MVVWSEVRDDGYEYSVVYEAVLVFAGLCVFEISGPVYPGFLGKLLDDHEA